MVRGESFPNRDVSMVALLKWLVDNKQMTEEKAHEIFNKESDPFDDFQKNTSYIWEH